MTDTVELQDWFVRDLCTDNLALYLAPELNPPCLAGTLVCGKKIRTSPIVAADGRVITTESGSRYRLGRVSRKYRAWLKREGRAYSAAEPVKVVTDD